MTLACILTKFDRSCPTSAFDTSPSLCKWSCAIINVLAEVTLNPQSSRINRVPSYDHILKLAKEREGAIFLDVGTCCEY